MPTDFDKQLWSLEWGPDELSRGCYPFHIDLLKNTLIRNREAFAGTDKKPRWVILHIGPAKECYDTLESLHEWEPRRFGVFA